MMERVVNRRDFLQEHVERATGTSVVWLLCSHLRAARSRFQPLQASAGDGDDESPRGP